MSETSETVDMWIGGPNTWGQWHERRLTGETVKDAVKNAADWFISRQFALGHPGGFAITDVEVTDTGETTEWYLSVVITTRESDAFTDMQPGRVTRTTLRGKHTTPPIRRTWTVKRHELVDGETLEIHTHATTPSAAILESLETLKAAGFLHGEHRPHATPHGGVSVASLGSGATLIGVSTWIGTERSDHEFEVRPVVDRGGRPTIDGAPGRTKTVPIALGAALTTRADEAAAAAGISRAELVRRAVAAYLPPATEQAEDAAAVLLAERAARALRDGGFDPEEMTVVRHGSGVRLRAGRDMADRPLSTRLNNAYGALTALSGADIAVRQDSVLGDQATAEELAAGDAVDLLG